MQAFHHPNPFACKGVRRRDPLCYATTLPQPRNERNFTPFSLWEKGSG